MIVQTQVDVGHVRLEIRQMAFHGGHAMAYITKLAFYVAKRGTNGTKMLKDQITRHTSASHGRSFGHSRELGEADGRSDRMVSA